MSLALAGTLAVSRDLAQPHQPIRCPVSPAPGRPADPAAGVASFSHLVIAQIPTEALIAYTTLLALFSVSADGYRPARWAVYFASLPVCAAVVYACYLRQLTTRVPTVGSVPRPVPPWLCMGTSVLAMATYGLTVPGSPLQFTMSGPGFAITSGCLSVLGGLAMSIFAPFLGRGNRTDLQLQPADVTDLSLAA